MTAWPVKRSIAAEDGARCRTRVPVSNPSVDYDNERWCVECEHTYAYEYSTSRTANAICRRPSFHLQLIYITAHDHLFCQWQPDDFAANR